MLRRQFLGASGLALLGASLPRLAVGEHLLTHSSYPQNLATPLEAFRTLETPTPVFFVRSHFGPPALKAQRKLFVTGAVKTPLELVASDLRRFPEVTVTAVLQCAGNGRALHEPRVPGVQWVHGAMGQARFTGIRLRDLLRAAGAPMSGSSHVRFRGADLPPKPTVPAWHRSLPLARALDPTTIVAYRMNGEPLTLSHGAPLRLVVPGFAGNHWLKWLTHIEAHAQESGGFYMQKGYRLPKEPVLPGASVPPEKTQPVTTFPVKSVIAEPLAGSTQKAGVQMVRGVAFSGTAGLAKVEVKIDDAAWSEAKLEGDAGPGRWQVFRHEVAVVPGVHTAVARATDRDGQTQPEMAVWNPSGYFWNAWHAVSWTVTA
jgi:DMSO/TMAO reductase YedYZ molybdopterin-dependent catalytic subunit